MITVPVGPQAVRTPATPPPCRTAPERWMDRTNRADALVTCLECPIRRWCAQEALRVRATWGMWAGIWIDGHPADVAHYLRAIAANPGSVRTVLVDEPAVRSADSNRPPLPRVLPRRSLESGSIAAMVLARSSGHCEILGANCRLSSDLHRSRVDEMPVQQAPTAASFYAACHPCADAIAAAGAQGTARALGYLVDAASQAPYVAFRWRGAHWVMLGVRGQLREINPGVRSARAS